MLTRDISRALHDERVAGAHRASAERRARAALRRPDGGFERSSGRSVRRSIGRSLVRLGQTIAAEPGQPVASP